MHGRATTRPPSRDVGLPREVRAEAVHVAEELRVRASALENGRRIRGDVHDGVACVEQEIAAARNLDVVDGAGDLDDGCRRVQTKSRLTRGTRYSWSVTGRRPDLHMQRLRVECRRPAGESVRRQTQADHQPLRGSELSGEGRKQGRRYRRGQGHPRRERHSLGAPVRKDNYGVRRWPPRGHELHPAARDHRWLTPPAADCNAATANTVVEVPYTAEYVFWKHAAA